MRNERFLALSIILGFLLLGFILKFGNTPIVVASGTNPTAVVTADNPGAPVAVVEGSDIMAASDDNPMSPFFKKIKISKPVTFKNLAIFPVSGLREKSTGSLASFDEAAAKKMILITEIGNGSVNELLVENTSSKYIFIMAGEILTGCKQDRMLKDDILIPPNSGKIKVAAYCTEHGRWTSKSETFASQKTASNIGVRQAARATNEQGKVWAKIEKTQENVSASPATGAMNETYQDKKVQNSMADYRKKFKDLPSLYPDMNGVIVAVNGEVLCADIFGDSVVMQKLYEKLLDSYILEALSRKDDDGKAGLNLAKAFLKNAYSADYNRIKTPGEGNLWEIKSSKIAGASLIYEKDLLHCELFPAIEQPIEKPEDGGFQRQY
ncbi:MAG: hypothetical protein M1536_00625 [Firmicutes bacterium]|nr:hypothetical protein [Bacillota bacterium]